MKFRTELHLHTFEVSACATEPAEYIAEVYAAAGYTTVVVTDHLNGQTFNNRRAYLEDASWAEKCDHFLRGYEALRKAAAGRFHVLLGMEICPKVRGCDYLIYGMNEEFLRGFPDMADVSFKTLVERLHEAGMMIYQAHPFRNGARVTDPAHIDGIESYNAHPGHDSRNDIASLWAKKFSLREIAGSDYHHAYQTAAGGIETDFPITSNEELLAVLREGSYTLLGAK